MVDTLGVTVIPFHTVGCSPCLGEVPRYNPLDWEVVMINFTEMAKDKIVELISSEDHEGMALRVQIMGRGPGGFRYSMRFVPEAEGTSSFWMASLNAS